MKDNIVTAAVNVGMWDKFKLFAFIYRWNLHDVLPVSLAYELKESYKKIHTMLRALEDGSFDRIYDELVEGEIEDLNNHSFMWRYWLDSCVRGRPDFDTIQYFLRPFVELNLTKFDLVQSESDPWVYTPKFTYNYKTVSTFINQQGFVELMLQNNLENYERVKQCKNCRSFFFPDSLKAKYCKNSCASAFHAKKRAAKAK